MNDRNDFAIVTDSKEETFALWDISFLINWCEGLEDQKKNRLFSNLKFINCSDDKLKEIAGTVNIDECHFDDMRKALFTIEARKAIYELDEPLRINRKIHTEKLHDLEADIKIIMTATGFLGKPLEDDELAHLQICPYRIDYNKLKELDTNDKENFELCLDDFRKIRNEGEFKTDKHVRERFDENAMAELGMLYHHLERLLTRTRLTSLMLELEVDDFDESEIKVGKKDINNHYLEYIIWFWMEILKKSVRGVDKDSNFIKFSVKIFSDVLKISMQNSTMFDYFVRLRPILKKDCTKKYKF